MTGRRKAWTTRTLLRVVTTFCAIVVTVESSTDVESCRWVSGGESQQSHSSPGVAEYSKRVTARNLLLGHDTVSRRNDPTELLLLRDTYNNANDQEDEFKLVKRRKPKLSSSIVQCNIRTLREDLDLVSIISGAEGDDVGGDDVVDTSMFFMFDNDKTVPMMVTRVKLRCNDVLFFESNMSSEQFKDLHQLREISIEKCKLKEIPEFAFRGLRHLRNLTINTGNADWAAIALELDEHALDGLPHLKVLNLGYNHMWGLPKNLLCQLRSLQHLNLTHNLLSSVEDLGLNGEKSAKETEEDEQSEREACLPELRVLDLSKNSLRSVGSYKFWGMRRLMELRLNDNSLGEMEDDALVGLNDLRVLNLSSNRLVALPERLLKACKSLRKLDLRNNSLRTIGAKLLDGLDRLQILDLSKNSISSEWMTTSSAFKSLVRLVILNLSENQLTHLSPSTFKNLYSVQVLDLSDNLVSFVAPNTFSPMSNLHSLNLGRNRLKIVHENMFNGLYVLHKLNLDYNEIGELGSTAFINCTSLQDLSLVGNKLTGDLPPALHSLKQLLTLDLGENEINNLTRSSFHGMSQLYGLRLVGNQLKWLPKGLCDPIQNLRVLNVNHNKIKTVSSSAFSGCPNLRVLRLDSNELDGLPDSLTQQLNNLLWLNVSENKIEWADYAMLPESLEWFDISHNHLRSLGGAWTKMASRNEAINPSVRNAKLRVVDASHNYLQELTIQVVPPSLEILRLSHNELKRIAADTFARSAHLRRVELIGNQIETIPLSSIRLPLYPKEGGGSLPEFFIGGNPFLCDCEMEWLTRVGQLSGLRRHPTVLDLDSIICRVEYGRQSSHVPLPEMKSSDFLCPYKSHCFALCHCCEFDACDCEMTCPNNCTCYHDDTWSSNVVNCASSGHSSIPPRLPMDSTQVYLDGNYLHEGLKSHIFIGRKNLRVLYLNGSGVETISNKSFNGLHSLSVLHLEENVIQRLVGFEFEQLTKLKELYLQNNHLRSIANTTFLSLKSLEILRLDGNLLSNFHVWQLSFNPYLVEIALRDNKWSCECQFLHHMYAWVSDNSRKLLDLNELRCVWNSSKELGPHVIDYNRTCSLSTRAWTKGLLPTLWSENFFPFILVLVCLIAFIILLFVSLLLCRESIKGYIYRLTGLQCCAPAPDSTKGYDAYFIYSEKDEEWLMRHVSDELEANDNYRLCLHYRDLLNESGDIKEMMMSGVDNSGSLMLFISRNFVQVEWTSCEYRSALQAIFKRWVSTHGKVTIVLIEQIPCTELHCDILRSWLRSHRRVNKILWCDDDVKKCWSKIRSILPHPEPHYHSNITTTTTTSAASTGSPPVSHLAMGASPIPNKSVTQWSSNDLSYHQPSPFQSSDHFTSRGLQPHQDIGSLKSPSGTLLLQSPQHKFQNIYPGTYNVGRGCVSTAGTYKRRHPLPSHHLVPEATSYLSLEGEHVYSTLDPPSPHHQIHLPNGYTYHATGAGVPSTNPFTSSQMGRKSTLSTEERLGNKLGAWCNDFKGVEKSSGVAALNNCKTACSDTPLPTYTKSTHETYYRTNPNFHSSSNNNSSGSNTNSNNSPSSSNHNNNNGSSNHNASATTSHSSYSGSNPSDSSDDSQQVQTYLV